MGIKDDLTELDKIAYKLFYEDYEKLYGEIKTPALPLNQFIILKTGYYYTQAEIYLRERKINKIKNVK